MATAAFAPARPGERLAHIDMIRGLALFGVLLMNVQYHFRGPVERFVLDRHPFDGFLNGVTDNALRLLVEGKAMTLFSMLFGVGLALQLERKETAGGGFWGFAWRRMGSLFGLGVLHILLLWYGDILAIYAIDGVLLFAFLRRKTRTLHIWLVCLVALLVAAVLVIVTVQMAHLGGLEAERARHLAAAQTRIDELLQGYLQPGWWDGMIFRVQHYLQEAGSLVPSILLAFLNVFLGLVVWRSGILRNPAEHLKTLRRAASWLFPLGFVACLLLLYSRPILAFALTHGGWTRTLIYWVGFGQVFSMQLMALAYGALLLLWWQKPSGRRFLEHLAPVGRMALTNYLSQSLVMGAVFYGWGLGLYGKVGPAVASGLCLLLYGAQVLASRWWLARFQFGPVEWLWRSLSYAHRQPFRLRAPVPAAPAEASPV